MSINDTYLDDQATLELLLATPDRRRPFYVASANVTIPFSCPHIDDIIGVIGENPKAKPFFLGMKDKAATGKLTHDEWIGGLFDMITALGSKTVNRIISLGTPWPNRADVVAAISRWSDTDRMKAILAIKQDGDWASFFALFFSSTPSDSPSSSDLPVGIDEMTAAVESTRSSQSESAQPSAPPASQLPTPSVDASIQLTPAPQLAPDPEEEGLPLLPVDPQSVPRASSFGAPPAV